MKLPDTTFEKILLAFLWAEKFTQYCLVLPFKLYMKYDYWSHNIKVAADAKYAAENPYTFPKSPYDND
tara:strand:- start:617 stop:820 length:204 start_codon:yes stop_codon:yes gene_type:complete